MSTNSKKTTPAKAETYKVLQKKLDKIQKILEQMLLDDKENTKEYRAHQRKQAEYRKRVAKTTEYKEQQLNNALNELHASLHSMGSVDLSLGSNSKDGHGNHDDNASQASSSSSSSSSGSSSSSSSSSSSEDSIDYALTLKKYDRVTKLLRDLEQEHGSVEACQSRKDYQKFNNKQKDYLVLLNKTTEWAEESYRRVEQEAIQNARLKAEQEQLQALQDHEQAVKAAREAQRAELEESKQAALAKIRAERAKKEEYEKAKEAAYRDAEKVANRALLKETELLMKETQQREQEYGALLQAQEERGLIKIIHHPNEPRSEK